MTRTDPATMITYLNTNWNTELGGTKPTFINEFNGDTITDIHQLGINWGTITWDPEARVQDTERNTLDIQIVEDSVTNMNTKLDHTRDLIKAKTLAGGHYMITAATPLQFDNWYIFFITVEEVMYGQ